MSKLPAVILARAGSKRLPNKALLPWNGETLLSNAIRVLSECRGVVSRIIVGTDSKEYAEQAENALAGIQVVMRPPVPDDQSSFAALRWVLAQAGLAGSWALLCQCTSPFINPADIRQLHTKWLSDAVSSVVYALSTGNGEPSGMAYIVDPRVGISAVSRQLVLQKAPGHDIDTMEDYLRALDDTPNFQTYYKP